MKKIFAGSVLLLILGFRFIHLGYGDLHSWDEAIHAGWARVVAEHGLWTDQTEYPVWDYQSHRYPPLFMWTTATAFKLFGISEATARLFPALCGALIVALSLILGIRWGGRSTGFWLALIVGCNYMLVHFSRFAMIESTYLLFLLAAYFAFAESVRAKSWKLAAVSGIAFGMAMMSKGVVGLLFPLGVVLFLFGLTPVFPLGRAARESLPKPMEVLKPLALSVCVGLVLAAPWHVFMIRTRGDVFIYDYFLWNVVERITIGVDGQTKSLGLAFYLNQLPIRIPFTFALFVISLVALVRRLLSRTPEEVRESKGGDGFPPTESRPNQRDSLLIRALLLCWFLVALGIFSVAQSKLVQYTPPILLPALMLSGFCADRLWRSDRWRRLDLLSLATPFVLAWASLTFWRLAIKRSIAALLHFRWPAALDLSEALLLLVVCAAIAIPLFLLARRNDARGIPRLSPRTWVGVLAGCSLLFGIEYAMIIQPGEYSSGARKVVSELQAADFRHLAVVSAWMEPPIIYYLGMPDRDWQKEHIELVHPEDLPAYLDSASSGSRSFLLLDLSDFREVSRAGIEFLGSKRAKASGLLDSHCVYRMEARRYELWKLNPDRANVPR